MWLSGFTLTLRVTKSITIIAIILHLLKIQNISPWASASPYSSILHFVIYSRWRGCYTNNFIPCVVVFIHVITLPGKIIIISSFVNFFLYTKINEASTSVTTASNTSLILVLDTM